MRAQIGPALPLAYLVFVAGVCAAIATSPDFGPEEVRAAIRATAFTSAVPFLLVFAASSANRLWRTPFTAWLVRERRYLGLSVAASHLWHLVAIVAFVARYAGGSEPIPAVTKVFGGGGFVGLALMAATSTDAAQRTLGAAWRRLHWLGVYLLWIDFTVTYSGTATRAPFHAVMTVAFVAAWALRLFTFGAARRT